jgi:uncharacterized protein involved in outer membrane biogenesis
MKLDDRLKSGWPRFAARCVVGVLLVWALAWLLVPGVLKHQLENRLTEQLGRKVSVGQVDFKPWSLELSMEDLAVAHASAADTTAQFSIKHLYIDMELQSLLRLAPVADAIQIDSPKLRLKYLGNGHYDVDDVLARLNQPFSAPPGKPLGFALYNLALSNGEATLEDTTADKVHKLTGLTVKVPFLSNLDSKRDIQVSPQLAFNFNGSPFDSAAQGTPFAENHKTEVNFKFHDLNLSPYLAYWPATLPLRLTSAVLDADVKLAFEQTHTTSLVLSGLVSASHVRLADPRAGATSGQELLAFETLKLPLNDVRPLEHKVQLGHVTWTQPQLAVQRSAQGVVNWQALVNPSKPPGDAAKKVVDKTSESGAAGKKEQDTPAWTVSVVQFDVRDGELRWRDATPSKPVELAVNAVNFSARQVQWPVQQSVPFEGRAQLEAAALSFNGTATDQVAKLTAKVTDAPLGLAKAYLADVLMPQLSGVLNAELGLTWQAAKSAKDPMQLVLQAPTLTLDTLVLMPQTAKTPLASAKQLQLAEVQVDLMQQTATVGRLRLTQPKATLARQQDGRWMFEDWFKAVAKPAATSAPQSASKPWQVAVNDLNLSNGDFRYTDATTAKPVTFGVSGVALQVKNFTTQGPKPMAWQLAASLRHGHTEPGSLAGRGTASLTPLAVQADVTAHRLPLHAVEPYLATALNVALLRADASFKGRLNFAQKAQGVALQLHGDAQLEDFRADTLAHAQPLVPAEELLSWKDLSLTGVDVVVEPGAATRLDVAKTVLGDFYAKLTLSEAGRLNLEEVLASSTTSAAGAAGVAVKALPASQPEPLSQNAMKQVAPSVEFVRDPGKNDIQTPAAPVIHFGPVSVTGGRVNFTDHFIKPNYSAQLTELGGKLSAFSSQTKEGEVQLSDLELRGRAEGTAALEIVGKLNPLAKPLALDIVGHVRDLELAPLSTYAVHYSGYGIERGKLNMDVAYKVQADGQLTASNKVVLHQLAFGEQVPGAPNSLPVKLAVALLADHDGVIDINLPLSGSINDPQFRVGPIVFKLIVNLIGKAITSPFSLLANAFDGGGDELSTVNFAPGSAILTPEARSGLEKVAHALLERPALKMTVVGTASLDMEREGFKREQLQAMVVAEKRRTSGDGAANTPQEVSAQEYPALLKTVYRRANFSKPRNLIGMTKDLPVAEMEALMLANLPATETAMQELAIRRGVAVRDHLASLKLPPERLFLGAAKAVKSDADWLPHAELNLSTQ